MFTIPAANILESTETVLVAGMGGGYDIYCGLPLAFALAAKGKRIHLANLSFASIYASNGTRHAESLVEIDGDTESRETYFPELLLARWLKRKGLNDTVFCIDRTGAKPISDAYKSLVELLEPDVIVLVDGGTDSLMRGDEPQLGTPQEDITSIAAVQCVDVKVKLIACVGFGIDTFHGVCHWYVLEAIAQIAASDGFYGNWSLIKGMPEVEFFREAIESVIQQDSSRQSIVNTSVMAAIDGQFGDFHSTERTKESTLFINPLMSQYWFFDLDAVAARNLYIDRIRSTRTYEELSYAIEISREKCSNIRPWMPLPM